MKLIFEIRDLKFATPATATRAGILFISENKQWHSMVCVCVGWCTQAITCAQQRCLPRFVSLCLILRLWLSARHDKQMCRPQNTDPSR